jgi:predicted dinucleotide-binding enzyme
LLDINNPVPDYARGDFLVKTFDGKSLSEAIAAYVPTAKWSRPSTYQARFGKWTRLSSTVVDWSRSTAATTDAKRRIATLITDIGCEAADVGELKYARLLEPAAAIVIKFLFPDGTPHGAQLNQPEAKPIA